MTKEEKQFPSHSSVSSKDEEMGVSSGSSTHGASNSTGTGPETKTDDTTEAIITQKEEKIVKLSKAIVLMVLTLASISTAVATYKYMKQLEKNQFLEQVSLLTWESHNAYFEFSGCFSYNLRSSLNLAPKN